MNTNQQKIRHLLYRATFGIHPEAFANWADQPTEKLVNALFESSKNFKDISHFEDIRKKKKDVGGLKVLKMILKSRKDLQELNLVWLHHISTTDAALREKMTLFWHNHFATSAPFPVLMQAQNNLIRKHALSNFKTLLHEIARDPAMIIYLNNQQNKKDAPNENFAREVMELFTLGRGNYAESDIKEAARAFTGWHVGKDGYFKFVEKDHDFGTKTVFNKTGNWNGDDILNFILEKKETSIFICTKLYKTFVSPRIDASFVDEMANKFREADYDISVVLRFMLMHDHFYDEKHRGMIIKSPVELIAHYKMLFQLQLKKPNNMIKLQKGLGQVLFLPPNVAGWPGDRNWIDSTTLLLRLNLMYLFEGKINYQLREKEIAETPTEKDKGQTPFYATMNWNTTQLWFGKALGSFDEDTIIYDVLINAPIAPPAQFKRAKSTLEQVRYVMSLPEFQVM